MGWIDWSWWMKEEEKPAEPLVLGAELECEYGSQRSFLMVETDEISINDLPKACVEDSIAHRNIHPFGQCLKNDECYFKMDLEERWVNAEPQTERVNGKEIITTSSTLICKAAGMAIRAVTSGQDGRFARFQQFLKNMERKYPGLRETLEDPYGSVYLEGNYEMALQFLEEQIKGRGEGLEIVTLYDPKNLEGAYILAALERLMTDCEVRSFEGFMNDLRDTANQQGMQGKEGWDQNYLNEAMMELLRKDCKETAERIETNPVYRGMEKHKMFGSWLRECTEAFAYTTIMYSSALAEGNSSGRRMEGDKGRGAVKKGEEKGKESGSVKGSSEMGGERVDGKGESKSGSSSRYDRTGYQSNGRSNNLFGRDRSTRRTTNLTEWRRSISQQDIHNEMRLFLGDDYVKIDSGKWRSLDGTRQFRVKPDDYLGNHGIGQPTVPNTPHVHFEFLTPRSNGNGFDVIKNIHVPIK